MKKIFLLLLLLSSYVYSQDLAFKSLDSLEFKNTTAELIKATNSDFKLVSDNNIDWRRYQKYTNSKNEDFFIVYFINMEGENKDLEIKGIKKWNIESYASKYTLIFDLYKRFYNKNADLEKIQKIGLDLKATTNSAKIRKTSQEGLWEIKLW